MYAFGVQFNVEAARLDAMYLRDILRAYLLLHDQAVDLLGKAVRAVAREPNGVIQAVELASKPFVLGVQWHPEYLPHHRRQQRLFEKLVDLAGQR